MKEQRRTKGIRPGLCLLAVLLCFPGPLRAEEQKGILATVAGRNITEADIADKIEAQLVRINTQIYAVKKQAVDALITDYLLEQEAKKRGLSREQLLQQEVNAKVGPVSDAEIEQVYNANKARLGDKPLAEFKPQIEQQLQGVKLQQQQQAFV
ncbi:MAG: hypothetical protein E6J80_02690, partial [Deltaproteobacteria bacterium]